MPVVGEPLAGRFRLVAPDVGRRLEAAASRPLPLGLGRQRLAGPGRVRLRVLERDVDDRLVLAPGERAVRPVGAHPACPRRPRPPLVDVPQVDGAGGHREDERAGDEVLGRRARKVRRVERPLGDRDVAGVLDEHGELTVRRLEPVDPEAVDRDAVGGRLLRVVVVGAHQELSRRDPGHALGCRARAQWPDVRTDSSFATAWSIVKLAAFCRGGNSMNVARNSVIRNVAASTR